MPLGSLCYYHSYSFLIPHVPPRGYKNEYVPSVFITPWCHVAQARRARAMRDEEHACGICIDRPRAARNLPCGHGGLCELCTINLVLQAEPSGPNCVYCRCTVSRLVVVPVTMATAGAGQVLPRRMPTHKAVPEPEGHVFESMEAFLLICYA